MIKNWRKPLTFLFLVYILSTCIDPYKPALQRSESLLVVDALLTNENRSYIVKISKTNIAQETESETVTGALVSIRDENGSNYIFMETGSGVYKSDSLLFQAETGHSYILNIKTPEGVEYESNPCIMYPVEKIERVYYSRDQEIPNNGSEIQEGIRLLIDSENSHDNQYYRWTYNEWWKTVAPDPKIYNYINDSTIIEVDQIKQICWRNIESDEIMIQSSVLAQTNKIEKQAILFIAPDKSDRLLIQYYIEVKQLSLSRIEYEFWDNMKQINESGGDIFDKQPFSIISNIHNTGDFNEKVLGYFQVSSVSHKGLYIRPIDISEYNLPFFNYNCNRLEIGENDYPPPITPSAKVTFNKIYTYFVGPDYEFVEPIYNNNKELSKLVFAKPICTDCTINGSLTKPDFWVDLK
jgi:uncharacterized protein DUF4249